MGRLLRDCGVVVMVVVVVVVSMFVRAPPYPALLPCGFVLLCLCMRSCVASLFLARPTPRLPDFPTSRLPVAPRSLCPQCDHVERLAEQRGKQVRDLDDKLRAAEQRGDRAEAEVTTLRELNTSLDTAMQNARVEHERTCQRLGTAEADIDAMRSLQEQVQQAASLEGDLEVTRRELEECRAELASEKAARQVAQDNAARVSELNAEMEKVRDNGGLFWFVRGACAVCCVALGSRVLALLCADRPSCFFSFLLFSFFLLLCVRGFGSGGPPGTA